MARSELISILVEKSQSGERRDFRAASDLSIRSFYKGGGVSMATELLRFYEDMLVPLYTKLVQGCPPSQFESLADDIEHLEAERSHIVDYIPQLRGSFLH